MWDPQKAFEQTTGGTTSVAPTAASIPTSTPVVKTGTWNPQKAFDTRGSGTPFTTPSSKGKWDPQSAFEANKPKPTSYEDSSILGKAISGASNYLLDKALSKKSIPQGIFDDATLQIGKAVGWCGVYASTISTAAKVGDQWAEKINKVDKRDGIKAGDKIVVPLGVDKNGKGYGHVMVALSDQDASGNVAITQSNADGRQNRGEGLGVATTAVYNVKDLQKRYGENWGAISGQLKVNPYADKSKPIASTPAPTIKPQAQSVAPVAPSPFNILNDGISSLANRFAQPVAINPATYKNSNLKDFLSSTIANVVPGASKEVVSNLLSLNLGKVADAFVGTVKDKAKSTLGAVTGVAQSVTEGLQSFGHVGEQIADVFMGKKVQPLDILKNTISGTVSVGNAALGAAFAGPTAAIGLLPHSVQKPIETIMNIPNMFVDYTVKGLAKMTGNNPDSEDLQKYVIAPLQLATNALLIAKGGEITDFVKEKSVTLKDLATTKKVQVSGGEVVKALNEITSGNSIGANPKVVEAVQKVLNDSKDAVAQKQMLSQIRKNGVTVIEARSFKGWFDKFFDKSTPQEVPHEVMQLLNDSKKVDGGQLSVIEFTKKAADILVPKGFSANLRDGISTLAKNLIPSEEHTAMSTKLAEMQVRDAQQVFEVKHESTPVLQIKTFNYSDGKVGASVQIQTEQGGTSIPMHGEYSSPRAAVQAITPSIEELVSKGSDTSSELIRTQLHDLKASNFESIPAKTELMPWDDNYTAPEPTIDLSKMSKEAIQNKIDIKVQDYITNALEPTMGQGVAQGGIIRDEKGVVVGRTGRVSNNPEWYQKFVKEHGKAPNKTQLREIAIDHLMNGVTDHSIGEMPADENFKQLMQQAQIAKPEKIVGPGGGIKEVKGTGETKVRGLALGVEAKAIENRLTDKFGDLPEYKTIKMSEQAVKVAEIIKKNPEQAKRIAMGEEKAPEGVLAESVLVAVENQAIKEGDVATLMDLSTKSKLTSEATTMGQRLRALAERDPESPVEAIAGVLRAREQAIERRIASREKDLLNRKAKRSADAQATNRADKMKQKAELADTKQMIKVLKDDIKKEIKEYIQKERPTQKGWADFIQSLQC